MSQQHPQELDAEGFREILVRSDRSTSPDSRPRRAWRASHLWAAWLVRHRGLSRQEAVRHAEAIDFGTLPIGKFPGADLELCYGEKE